MTSKTFLDSGKRGLRAVFLWQLRRSLPLAAVYAAALLAVSLFPPYFQVSLIGYGVVVTALAALLPVYQFGACFSRRQADLFHALPVRRGDFFLGSFLSSFVCLWTPLFPALGVRCLLCAFSQGMSPVFTALPCMGSLFLIGTAALAVFMLAAAGSSTYLGYGLNSLLLTFCYPLLLNFSVSLIERTVPGADNYLGLQDWLFWQVGSPPVALFFSYQGRFENWTLLWWPVFAALLLAAGYFLYSRRDSEAAGSSRTCKPLEIFLRVEIAVTATAFAGNALSSIVKGAWGEERNPFYFEAVGIPLTLGAMGIALAAAWVLTELVYHRSLKRLFRHLSPLVLSAVLMVLGLAVISTGMGLDTAQPKTEEIMSAEVFMEPYPVLPGGFYGKTLSEDGAGQEEVYINAGVCSPERIEQIRTFQQKWVELERSSQFPYLPGRSSYPWTEYVGMVYHMKDGRWVHVFYPSCSGKTEKDRALYQECTALIQEITCSEEFLYSLPPLCAIDAAGQIGKKTVFPEERADTETVYYDIEDMPQPDFPLIFNYTDDPTENALSISSLKDSANFRKKLEAALLEDLSHNRCPTDKEVEQKNQEGKPVEVYEIRYENGSRFTARGGMGDSGPVQGKEMVLDLGAGYPTGEHDDEDYVFRIWPEMTETYALLKSQYEK